MSRRSTCRKIIPKRRAGRRRSPPFALRLPAKNFGHIWIYLGGHDAGLAWRMANWRDDESLPVLLVPSGDDPLSYRWPRLRCPEVFVVALPGADLWRIPRLALRLLENGANVVRVSDVHTGKLTVYRNDKIREVA